jgi:hypothetical protein
VSPGCMRTPCAPGSNCSRTRGSLALLAGCLHGGWPGVWQGWGQNCWQGCAKGCRQPPTSVVRVTEAACGLWAACVATITATPSGTPTPRLTMQFGWSISKYALQGLSAGESVGWHQARH